jgi:hypothetical protein
VLVVLVVQIVLGLKEAQRAAIHYLHLLEQQCKVAVVAVVLLTLEAMAVQQVHTELELLQQIAISNQVMAMHQVLQLVVQLVVAVALALLVQMHLVAVALAVLVLLIAFLVHH